MRPTAAIVAGVLLTLIGAAAAATPLPASPGDGVLLQRAIVPQGERPVGEVRLVRRGEATVVETILYTSLLRRVVAEIQKKEAINWPEGSLGHADSLLYHQALAAAQAEIWSRMPKFDRHADQRQKLLIEFAVSPASATVTLSEFDMRQQGDEVTIDNRRLMKELPLSRHYIERNLALIAADALGLSAEELAALIAAGVSRKASLQE